VFDKHDVAIGLDFEPRRSTLYLALSTLEREGVLAIAREPSGQQPTLYRRATAAS
jgi:DNA-binding PadR family transcriptional regulator